MEFLMNNHKWEIIEASRETISTIYKESTGDDTLFMYGLTKFSNHKIYINEEMCKEMKRKTLLHELLHCYIEEYVSIDLDNFNEETMCNICANSHDIIHEIIEKYDKVNG